MLFHADQALCKDHPAHLFYEQLGPTVPIAKAICERCPIQAECLDWAIEQQEEGCIWGGKTAKERETERRRRRRMQ